MRKFIAAVAVLATTFGLGTAPASAGTNGQQIRLCPRWGTGNQMQGGTAYIAGINEHGLSVSGWFGMNALDGQCWTDARGWWWKYNVTVDFWSNTGAYLGRSYDYVPEYSTRTDWYDVVNP
ncbi:hypothetical protein ABZX92_19390 [Lentzea sp. NPDC006480]|uniref:hypothetical protein n=1 Tax=Lentzea sp. NPDC006480 TaxID=3157176 RepID=UPI0033B82390